MYQEEEHIKDRSLLWDQYVKEAEVFDQNVVQGLAGDLDALLIFAGLFSAINTAFIIESYQDLKPDPTDATTLLLRTIAYNINNSTVNPEDLRPGTFVASRNAIIVNSLYFASLSCSLFAAFGAVLAKQWLNEYRRTGKKHRSSCDRAHRRHIKYLGMEKYHSELIVQALGTILQISLFLFLAGVADWLWAINHIVASVVASGAGLIFLFYVTTTIISVIDHSSPFSTRVSVVIRSLWPALRRSKSFTTLEDGECMAWLRDNATTFESISVVANAIVLLPPVVRTTHNLRNRAMCPTVLRSIICNSAIPTGLSDGSLHATLITLLAVLPDSPHSPQGFQVMRQLIPMLRIVITRDESLSPMIVRVLGMAPTWSRLSDSGLDRGTLMKYFEIPSLSCTDLQAGTLLLYHHFIRDADIEDLRADLQSALFDGVSVEKTWQWRLAEVLKRTRRFDNDLMDRDLIRHEFREKWALVFLQKTPKYRVYPCPLWTGYYIDDTEWRINLPPPASVVINLNEVPGEAAGIGLLVLLQYVWDSTRMQEGGHMSQKSNLTPELRRRFSPVQSDLLKVSFSSCHDLHIPREHRLVLIPLLWLADFKKVRAGDVVIEVEVLERYSGYVWWILMNHWGGEWMATDQFVPYLEGFEALLVEIKMAEFDPQDVTPSYCKGYLQILKQTQQSGFSPSGDYEIIERFESCIDALATAFGVDVKRTKKAYMLDGVFDIDGEAFELTDGTKGRHGREEVSEDSSEDEKRLGSPSIREPA